MADSTHTSDDRGRARLRFRLGVCATVVAFAFVWSAGPALADGDPASDVLATQTLFLPQDAGLPVEEQTQLVALLAAAHHSGYQLRVALVASSADLGSVTELWRQPQNYAQFLGQELSLVYRGPVLVVMPNGFGLYRLNRPLTAEQSALVGIRAPTATGGLGTAALTAIRRLAAASGHTLPVQRTTAPSTSSSTDTVSWLAFAIGTALIALAWTASLRAQPPHTRNRRTSPT